MSARQPAISTGTHPMSVVADAVDLGPGSVVEEFCVLGRHEGALPAPGRTVIGPWAVIRSHTVIYAGCAIGTRFRCGHHVLVREGSEIGDDVSVGSMTPTATRAQVLGLLLTVLVGFSIVSAQRRAENRRAVLAKTGAAAVFVARDAAVDLYALPQIVHHYLYQPFLLRPFQDGM